MSDITGPPVTLDGTAIEGAQISVIDGDTGEFLGSTTTDVDGNWTVTIGGGQTVHVLAEYEDADGNLYQEHSKPLIPTETSVTVIEDHEAGGAITDYYAGDTGSFTIVNDTTLEGDFLVSINGQYNDISYNTTGVCSRGNRYQFRLYADVASSYRPLAFVQDTANPLDNSYGARVYVSSDRFEVQEWDAGTLATSTSTTVTLSAGTEYRPVIEVGATGTTDNVVARLYDASGTELASTAITSDLHTGGTYGFYSDAGSGYFDYITEEPL